MAVELVTERLRLRRAQRVPAGALAEVELQLVEPGRAGVGRRHRLAAQEIAEGRDGGARDGQMRDERLAEGRGEVGGPLQVIESRCERFGHGHSPFHPRLVPPHPPGAAQPRGCGIGDDMQL